MASSSSTTLTTCFCDKNGEALPPLSVTLTINKATNLRDADIIGHSDPYVIATLKLADPHQSDRKRKGKEIGRTSVKEDTLNPVWEQTLDTFQVSSLATVIKFELRDRDTLSKDDYLGTAHLRLWDHVFDNDSAEEVWLQLVSTKESCKAQGALKVTITVSGLPTQVYEKVRLIGLPSAADADELDKLLQQYLREQGIAPDPKQLNLAGHTTEIKVEEDGSSYVTVPLITNRVVRVPSESGSGDSWAVRQTVVGGSLSFTPQVEQAQHQEVAASSSHAEHDGNPWETPKKPPKESTYNWSNWGQTIFVKTRKQWHPTSLEEIVAAVRDATANGVQLRCVAHAHSWTPLFGDNGNDLIFLHKLDKVTKDLTNADPNKWTITAQGGATNAGLAAMLTKNSLFLPTNVISTEFLVGGVLSTGSHGSGWNEGLVLDSVVQLKIVDGHGRLRTFTRYTDDEWTVEDPQWTYVVLNLGMFGIVYEITYRVQRQLQRALTRDWYVKLDKFWNTDLHEQVITGEHYTELFWFPFNDTMWVKTWGFTDQPVKWHPLRTAWVTFAQWLQSKIGHFVGPLIAKPVAALTPAFCKSAMGLLKLEFMGPEDKPKETVCSVPDALHWRKFLDSMSVWNCEVAVNLPTDASGKTDVSAAKDLWMFVIDLTNDIASGKVKIPGLDNIYPNNVTLEARFIKNTCAWLSNAHGNDHTMFIEWVTNTWTPGWKEYSNYIMAECFKRYPTSCRSHWAKYQQDMPGWIAHNRDHYGARFDRFKQVRAELDVDPNNTFTTSWLRAMFDLH